MKLRFQRREGGMMMIEVLIAILLFSLGILTMLALQANAVATITDTKFRADATLLADRLIGEMWADSANVAAYAYTGGGTPPATLTTWVGRVQSTLPGVAAPNMPSVTINAGNEVVIDILWKAPSATNVRRYRAVTYINP